jgi:hypothetical protein
LLTDREVELPAAWCCSTIWKCIKTVPPVNSQQSKGRHKYSRSKSNRSVIVERIKILEAYGSYFLPQQIPAQKWWMPETLLMDISIRIQICHMKHHRSSQKFLVVLQKSSIMGRCHSIVFISSQAQLSHNPQSSCWLRKDHYHPSGICRMDRLEHNQNRCQ